MICVTFGRCKCAGASDVLVAEKLFANSLTDGSADTTSSSMTDFSELAVVWNDFYE